MAIRWWCCEGTERAFEGRAVTKISNFGLQSRVPKRGGRVIRPACLLLCLAAPVSAACSGDRSAAPKQDTAPSGLTQTPTGSHDWTRFGWDAARSNASPDSTGITPANVATLVRQQVTIDGTVDASPIYLHGVTIGGAAHDAFVVTTTYGKTLAIDANDGSRSWEFTPDATCQRRPAVC